MKIGTLFSPALGIVGTNFVIFVRLFSYEPAQDKRTDGQTDEIRVAAYWDGRTISK